jgi:hypothetical protein
MKLALHLRACPLPLMLGLLAAACGKGERASKGERATSSASARASASAPLPAPPASAPPLPPICRALRVTGEAKVGDAPLASGVALDGSEWVSLAKGAQLTLKHAQSGRELAVAGPALFRACRRGREQLLLARGSVVSTAGMGSRPGAEVLIATPVATVHYADAELTLELSDTSLSIAVRVGSVEVAGLPPPKKPHKSPLKPRDTLRIVVGKPDPARLIADCKAAAERAEQLARRVADASATEPLGQRAQAHVKARKLARSSCAVAAAATGLVADPVARAGLWAEATRWEGLSESVPGRGRAQAAEK